jgi:hypothetical protein
MGHDPIHGFLESKEAGLDRQVGVFGGLFWIIEPPRL